MTTKFVKVADRAILDLVDDLGNVKAKIASLKSIETELKEALVFKADKVDGGEFLGQDYRATVSHTDRVVIGWRAVVEALPDSGHKTKLINKNTSHTEVTTVRVSAHKS